MHVQLGIGNLQVGGDDVLLHDCHGGPPHGPMHLRRAVEANPVDDARILVTLDSQVFRTGDGFVLGDVPGGFGENFPDSVRVLFVGEGKVDVVDSRHFGNLGDVPVAHGHRVAGVQVLEYRGHQGETQNDSLNPVDFHYLTDDDGVVVDDVNPHDNVLEEILHSQAGDGTDDAHAGNHGSDVDIVSLKDGENADDKHHDFDTVEHVPHEGPEADVFLVNPIPIFLGDVVQHSHNDKSN